MESTRKFDSIQEDFLTQWLLVNYFVPNYKEINIWEDKGMQVKGVDVTLDGMLVDIKGMTSKRYLNNPADTYSLELSFLNREGDKRYGWFVSDDMITTHYLFVWINKCEHQDGLIRSIEEVEVMLVDKAKLQKYVIGNNKEAIMKQGDRLRNLGIRSTYLNNGLKMVCSNQLAEIPVNVIVPKDTLAMYAIAHKVIKAE